MANSVITQLLLRDTEYLTIQVVDSSRMYDGGLDSSIDSYIKAVHFELSFPLGGRCRVTSFFVTAGCSVSREVIWKAPGFSWKGRFDLSHKF